MREKIQQQSIDILALTETWLKVKECSDFIIRDISHSTPRSTGTDGGGISLLYRKDLKIEQLETNAFKSFEFKELLLHPRASISVLLLFISPEYP